MTESETEEATEADTQQQAIAQHQAMAESVPEPALSLKYVLLGMILFAFIYVFYLFLKYILSSRLRAADEVQVLYGTAQLGKIPRDTGKKKVFAVVDDLIVKLRDRNKRVFSYEEAVGLAAVAVRMSARKNDLNKVFCIGCNMQEPRLQVAQAIQADLQEADLEMTVLNNVLYNQEALEQLQDAKGAFLLEQAGETLYDEIARELELLRRQEIAVLGIVVVE